jgi:hypothetical protein
MELVKDLTKQKLSDEEMAELKSITSRFARAKADLADAEIRKHSILGFIERLSVESDAFEKAMSEKYGAGAAINMQTGEVTVKTDAPN